MLTEADQHLGTVEKISVLMLNFINNMVDIRNLEIDGQWAELNAPQDLAHFILGTKAETLERLRPLVRSSIIGQQVQFTVEA